MSLLDSEQEVQLSSTRPLVTDKNSSEDNAETEIYKTYDNPKSDDNINFEYRLSPKFIKNKRFYGILIKMYHIVKELALMFFLALTYAALTNNPPKVSKSPQAVPFFSKSPYIQDWYRGELSAAMTKARQSDIAFIMFYAPWDAECQAVRHEFDLAAKYMYKEVTFMAVNCWQPGSDCRNQYLKAYNWPIFMAYVSRGKGIQYRGVISAPYMVKFLTALTRPLLRIHKETEVDRLLGLHDAIMLGCLSVSPGSSDYSVLYNTAITILEHDPVQEVPFVVLTGSNNTCLDGYGNRMLSLHLWNETLVYPADKQWKPESIIIWIQKNLHEISTWAFPHGTKSFLLSTYIQPGPTLVFFTPKNPMAASDDYYSLLREVALEYHDCGDNHRIKLISILIHKLRIENYLKNKAALEECGIKQKIIKPSFPSVVTYTIANKWANNSCCQLNNENSDSCSQCDTLEMLKEQLPSDCKQGCSDSSQYDINSNIYKSCDTTSENKLKSTLDGESNSRLSSNLQKSWEEEKCRRARFAQKVYPYVYSETISNLMEYPKGDRFDNGLGCKINTTLSFIALDSLQYFHFAERLGLDLGSRKDRTAAVILHDKMETHHVIEGPINDETLRQFVANFTSNNLGRTFTSESDIKPAYTHVYSSKEQCSAKGTTHFCLRELNSETFLPTVMQDKQVVIVLYYSKQCAFCSGISYTFLTVAKMFSSISVMKFVRINGDLNTLPWEFTMDRYPTILFFPFKRKAETRVFPPTMPITVSNIISFLLNNLNPTLNLHVMHSLCNQISLEDDRLMCIASARTENLSLIEHTLRAWRIANPLKKRKLLYKLQQLRNINLWLALYPQNNYDLNRYLSQLHWSTEEDEVLVKTEDSENKYIRDEL